tara:strand:- start:3580 stop:4188 length:609 start_codon:yes stop_codon:yes gene_type:complete
VFTNNFLADVCCRIWEVPRLDTNEIYDVGIILGGIADYDKITKAHNFNKYADRLIDGEQLYHQGTIKKIMISGGNGTLFNNEYLEADAIRNHLINNKIPSEDILIENKSRNTKENALNSAKILNVRFPKGKFLLITSANHMKRAEYCFKKTGINTTSFPTDCTSSYSNINASYLLLPSADALEKWESLIHEWIGNIVYRITF